ncbi:hypothetical protein GCM10025867_37890 [Frondihabitans sucicola]|uniref:Uncharacterized protein n=1 Tax=Frondihabitans sucicola TaxID=1268041 RepID=A0ABM8GSU6_9MICO|nr:hypothetical protein GCM10025867_37890 [Frondihabitans sucicola]
MKDFDVEYFAVYVTPAMAFHLISTVFAAQFWVLDTRPLTRAGALAAWAGVMAIATSALARASVTEARRMTWSIYEPDFSR